MEQQNKNLVKIEASWNARLASEFEQSYMQELKKFLKTEYEKKRTIYPAKTEYFSAFNLTPFDQVKVVILGQDPYHGTGQAHGLSFSVPRGIPAPPSLVNIFKELQDDLKIKVPEHGNLMGWAKEGVLLLNSVLTVEMAKAGSHRGRGWEKFTDSVIQKLSAEREHLVFILWGAYAQSKKQFIDKSKHLILESPHPSPLSSYRGFFGSKPFSKTNKYLQAHGVVPVNWGHFE